jgi:hypothetical protein
VKESADHHDAELMLRLYELRREEKLRKAREWFMREFKAETAAELAEQCPPGSDEDAFARMVAGYWEMAASIVNHGLIKPEFFYESNGEFFIVWAKLAPVAAEMRQARKNPRMFENLEALAADYEKWMNKRAPGALSALRERMGLKKI